LLGRSSFFARAATFVNPSENGRSVAIIAEIIAHRKKPLLGVDLEVFSLCKDWVLNSSSWLELLSIGT
jgi:hypothetical protein